MNKNFYKNSLFNNLKQEDLNEIIKSFKQESFKKNEVIFYEKDHVNKIYIIETGLVEIIKYDYNGIKNIVNILANNDMFAESVVLSYNQISPYTTSCLENTIIYSIDKEKFKQLSLNYPQLSTNMQEIIANKNTFLTFKIDCLSKKTIKEKVYEFLRYYSIKQESYKVDIPFNKTQLADFLCVNRSALSRELSIMEKDEVFKTKKKTYILNKDKF